MTHEEFIVLLHKAYLLGFNDSSEGNNGEYPFRAHDQSPTSDEHWITRRRHALNKLLAQKGVYPHVVLHRGLPR